MEEADRHNSTSDAEGAILAAADAATGDDKRILALCARLDALEHKRRDMYPQSKSPRIIWDDDERDNAIEPIQDEQEAIIAELAPLNASSPAAVAAVIRSLDLWCPDYAPCRFSKTTAVNEVMLGWILQNVSAIDGRGA